MPTSSKRWIAAPVAALIVCSLGACSGASTDSAPTTAVSAVSPERVSSSVSKLADTLGCTGAMPIQGKTPGVSSAVTCSWQGTKLRIYGFRATGDQVLFWTALSKKEGLLPSRTVRQGLVVVVPSEPLADQRLQSLQSAAASALATSS